jgi:hypothetical protein
MRAPAITLSGIDWVEELLKRGLPDEALYPVSELELAAVPRCPGKPWNVQAFLASRLSVLLSLRGTEPPGVERQLSKLQAHALLQALQDPYGLKGRIQRGGAAGERAARAAPGLRARNASTRA